MEKVTAKKILRKGKKMANELKKEGMYKAHEIEDVVKEYSDELTQQVKTYPLTSLLIAGGVGYILSKILSK